MSAQYSNRRRKPQRHLFDEILSAERGHPVRLSAQRERSKKDSYEQSVERASRAGGHDLRAPSGLHQINLLAILRHFNRPSKSIAQVTRHCIRFIGLAVSDEHLTRRRRHVIEPTHHFFPICM